MLRGIKWKVLTKWDISYLTSTSSYEAELVKKPHKGKCIEQGPTFTAEQQISLCKSFTDKDIKEAIFSISNVKSLGRDGYKSGFFKTAWHLIGPLVCVAVQDSFKKTGHMPKHISSTKLVILPKISHPQTAFDFRPISCCSVVYQCISKLLCQRIKEVLPSLINPSQGAFVKGRELLYNVLICQDIPRSYQRQSISPRCILKVDLQKAFTQYIGTFWRKCCWHWNSLCNSSSGLWLMSLQ